MLEHTFTSYTVTLSHKDTNSKRQKGYWQGGSQKTQGPSQRDMMVTGQHRLSNCDKTPQSQRNYSDIQELRTTVLEFATWTYLFFLERAVGILSLLKARGIFFKKNLC